MASIRTHVEKARNALIARGIHPSGDAVRVELGNTGSKSTIHKYLRENEATKASDGDQEKVLGSEIGDLFASLAARLTEDTEDADARSVGPPIRLQPSSRGDLLIPDSNSSSNAKTVDAPKLLQRKIASSSSRSSVC